MPREKEIAAAARLVKLASRFGPGRTLVRQAQRLPVYKMLLGYRRPFATLEEARAAVAAFPTQGHEGLTNVRHHLELSAQARPSDYAALFHMRPLLPALTSVFDLGGNAGNLYYCYSRYLDLPANLRWTVQDLPANMAAGEEIARERGATALHFTNNWQDASGVGLLLVSGSLHYLETPLPEMIAQLPTKPARILINRTPLVEGEPIAAVQAASGFRLACRLYNRTALLNDLIAYGYELVDEWKATELSMEIPGYPEFSVPAYSGAFLRLTSARPLKSEILAAMDAADASLARGEGRIITEESMAQLAADIKERGRARLAAAQNVNRE